MARRSFGRRPRGISRGVRRGRGRVVVNNNNRNNNNRIQDVAGFSNLAQQGNNLFEKDPFIPNRFRRLFIDPRTGRLIGNRFDETRQQLREFYLQNFDRFRGNARNLVQSFLLANGARDALFGNLRVDLATGVAPAYKNMSDGDARVAALNYLLNTISQTSRLLRVGRNNVAADGTVNLNLRGAMRSAALALLTNDNPYSCGTNAPPRLDWLIERAMNPNIYYQLIGAPQTLEELTDQMCVEDDRRRTLRNKIVIAAPPGQPKESAVAVSPERTLEFQTQRCGPAAGGDFFISWDTIANVPPGIQKESRNPFIKGINFTIDASEYIYHKSNGFLAFGLANAAGQRQNVAPAGVALAAGFGRAHLGDEVGSPLQCLNCHANGFIAGDKTFPAGDRDYTENFGRIPSFSRQFFTTKAVYNQRRLRGSAIFLSAMKRSGSFIPSDGDVNKAATVVPDFVEAYRSDLSFEQAAKELGTTTGALAAALGRSNGKFRRQEFERAFCSLKARVGGQLANRGGVLDGGFNRSFPGQGFPGGNFSRGFTGRNHSGGTVLGGPTRRRAF